MKILFVCRGNHARSQIAEAILDKVCMGKWEVISAGTKVITEDKNREGEKVSDPNIITVMKEIGIEMS